MDRFLIGLGIIFIFFVSFLESKSNLMMKDLTKDNNKNIVCYLFFDNQINNRTTSAEVFDELLIEVEVKLKSV